MSLRVHHSKEKGIALITAMLVVAMAGLIATDLVWEQHLQIRRTESMLAQEQARMYALAAETIGIEVNGVMKVNHGASFSTTGIEIISASADLESIALVFQVLVSESESEGDISITFDRTVFDAKIGNVDDEFFIIADGEEITFTEEKGDDSRTLSFSILERGELHLF